MNGSWKRMHYASGIVEHIICVYDMDQIVAIAKLICDDELAVRIMAMTRRPTITGCSYETDESK